MTPADWRRLGEIAEECRMWVVTRADVDEQGYKFTNRVGIDATAFITALRKEAERVEVEESGGPGPCVCGARTWYNDPIRAGRIRCTECRRQRVP